MKKYSLVFPFISSLCIVLNLYNGDILGIPSNYEYLIWYIPSFFQFIYYIYSDFNQNLFNYLLEILVCLFSFIANIYWRYAWIKDASKNYRHRTEFYDTQCLLSGFLFIILYNQYQIDLYSKKKKITQI